MVRGRSGGEPRVRVVGGEGDDTLVDSSGVGLSFYDAQGDNRIEALPGTRVDRRPYAPPASEAILPVPRRDRGTDRRWLYPSAEWVPDVGLRVGAGPRWRRYGFRRDPFAWSHSVVPRIVPGPWRGGVAYVGADHPESSEAHLALRGDAGNDHVVRFAGIGNDPSDVPGDLARTWYRRYEAAAEWVTPLPDLVAPGLTVAIGSLVRYTDPEPEPGSPLATLRPLGVDGLGEVGVRGRATLDTRDDAGFPRRGYRVEADLTALAPFDRDADPYGLLAAEASGYRPVRVGVPAILAGRVGAEGLLGDAPVWEIPEVGGRNTLRGWSHGRLKGGVALYGTLELRVPLLPARILANGTVGLSGFVDAGRVWDDGRSPGGWRRAAGAGAWFSVALEWARGDVHSLYMRLGLGL
ncbi:MAG: BamA/TamA family outer membrane protein [Gemmatimonadota bacterium]